MIPQPAANQSLSLAYSQAFYAHSTVFLEVRVNLVLVFVPSLIPVS